MTALDAQVKTIGLIGLKALVDHAIDNGLHRPETVDLHDDRLQVWLSNAAADKWIDSIHVDNETVAMVIDGRDIVHVNGRLPLLGVKVQLRYSRVAANPAHLTAVS